MTQIGDSQFDAGRLAFLRRIADAPQIYRTPTLAALFEARARANIAREIGRLAG